MENNTLSVQYQRGVISKEIYDYCQKHNMNTLDDIVVENLSEAERILLSALIKVKEQYAAARNEEENESIILSDEEVEALNVKYKKCLAKLTETRSKNVLEELRKSCESPRSFFKRLLSIKGMEDFRSIPKAGLKTALTLYPLIKELKDGIFVEPEREAVLSVESIMNKCWNDDYDRKLMPFIGVQLSKLEAGPQNRFREFFERDCRGSLKSLYIKVSEPGFDSKDIKGVGAASQIVLNKFFGFVVETMDKIKADANQINNDEFLTAEWVVNGLVSEKKSAELIKSYRELGYFPILKAVDCYVQSLDSQSFEIVSSLIAIFKEQTLIDRRILAEQLGLSYERVRQLRNEVLKHIGGYIAKIAVLFGVKNYSLENIFSVNDIEGTSFNKNFLYFFLSKISSDYVIVGNIQDALFKPYGHDYNLTLIPSRIYKIFDFQRFMKSFSDRADDSFKNDHTIDLKDFICGFFTTVECSKEDKDEVLKYCKDLIQSKTSCPFDGEFGVVIEANTYKTLPFIIEEILIEEGHPMTRKAVAAKIRKKYPDRKFNENSLNCNNNPNIQMRGREGVFTLTRWTSAQKGGTIRSFALEFINSSNDFICKEDDLVDYIQGYRPESKRGSIVANLLAPDAKSFTLYVKDGERYFGLATDVYDDSYVKFDKSHILKRNFKDNIARLVEFIKGHQRFPIYSSKEKLERSLNRFWYDSKVKFAKGTLSEEDSLLLKEVHEKYGFLEKTRSKK